MNDENIRRVYEQDCENARYQDNLRWSRFKTISLIEGFFLVAAYQGDLRPFDVLIVVCFGCSLVLIVSLLAIKDGFDVDSYFDRINEVEAMMAVRPIKFKRLFNRVRGKHLHIIAVVIVNLFNLIVIAKALRLF